MPLYRHAGADKVALGNTRRRSGETELARLFVILGGLIVLALTAALVGPHFYNWSNLRAEFEREAGRILGRQVTVRGDVDVRLLPFTYVTFKDVEVAGPTPGESAMTVEAFSMYAELTPLLSGELLIFDMRLERPKARLAIADDGTVDWALRPSAPFDPRQVKLEKLTVTEGRIDVFHATSQRTHELTEVNADISANSLAGPWRIDGSARIDGMLTQLLVTTGSVDNSGKMRLRVRADPDRYAFNLETDGDATLKAGALNYEGAFKLTARDSEKLRGGEGGTFPLAGQAGGPKPPAYRVSGEFGIDHRAVDVKSFRFETGPLQDPYTADGHARIGLGEAPDFAIFADGAQLRFEDAAAGETSAIALAERLSAFREAVLDLPQPAIPGTVEVNLPAIVAGDTTIREVRLSAASQAEGDGWTISSLGAVLPGRTALEASGLLRTGLDDFGFTGRLVLAVNQPSGFAAWLSKDVDEAIRRLPGAGFEADVELGERMQIFENLELDLGGATFTGLIVNERPENARPSMKLELDGGQLDLDGLAAFASLFVSDTGDARLSDHDLDFDVQAGPVTVAGVTAESVSTQMRMRDGQLDIDELNVDGLEGTSLATTGKLSDIGRAPAGWVDVDVVSGDLAPLAALLASRFPGNAALAALDARAAAHPSLLADANFKIKATLAPFDGEAAIRVAAGEALGAGALGGGTFSLDLAAGAAGQALETPFTLKFTAANDDASILYALYGLPTLGGLALETAGAARTELAMDGTLGEGAQTTFSFTADDLSAGFRGSVGIANGSMTAEGDGSLVTGDLNPWLLTAGQPMPGMGLRLPVELKAAGIDLRDGLLVLPNLSGKLADMALDGEINAQIRDGLPHLTGAVTTDLLDLALPAEVIFGAAPFEASSEGGWPQAPFAPAARPPFTADVQFTVDRVIAGPLTAEAATFDGKLDREGMSLSNISAELMGGRVSGLAELRNSAGTALLSAQLTLEGATLGALAPEAGVTGVGDFSASVTSSGKSVESLVASLAGSGTAVLRELSLPGLRPDALAQILAKADEAGTRIDAEQTRAFAPEIVSGGRFDADGTELALTIASGVVHAPPVRLERPEAVLTVEPRIDIAGGTVGASGTIEYRPGEDAVAGAEPAVRFSAEGPPGAVAVSYDVEPLAQYLTQRALEREQARVEAMQAVLLERQRLRREVRYYAALSDERARAEEERRRLEEEQRLQEEARLRAEQEAAREAEEARRAAEEDARRAAEEAARRSAEEDARRAAEEAARQEPRLQPEVLPQIIRPPAGADGLPGVQRSPLILPARPQDGADASGVIQPETLTVDGLLEAIQPD